MTRRHALSVAVLLFVLVGAPAALARKVVPDVSGSAWLGSGKFRVAIPHESAQNGPADFTLGFGPSADLGGGEFLLEFGDVTGTVSVPGTFTIDPRGRPRLGPDVEELEEQLRDFVQEAVGMVLPGLTIDLEVVGWKLAAKPKTSKRNGDSIAVKGVFRSILTVTYLGETRVARMNIKYRGKGVRD